MDYDDGNDPFTRFLEIQRRDFTHYVLPELFQNELGGFLEFFGSKVGQGIDPAKFLAESAAAKKRLAYVSRLAEFGVKVWGDDGWKEIEGDGIEYMGPAGHHHELNKIYNGSLINLEISRLYQMDVVNMRVFDIMACGGFVLAEYCESLEELFNVGEEVIVYHTLDEMADKVRYYLEHQDEAGEIANRGMAAVRERHTIKQRIEKMLNHANQA